MAKEFISWLNPPTSWDWLDVGCGTGALTQAICAYAHPRSIVACDPSPEFVAFARRSISLPAVSFFVAGVDELPRQEGGFDAVVAGLVLNFIPNSAAAIRSMRNRLHPGGTLAIYVWDYAEGMQFLRIFWEVAAELDPRAAELDEGQRFPLCRRDALVDLLERENFEAVEASALEIDTPFPDFDNYWVPFLGGTGSGPSYVSSLSVTAREELRLRLRQRLTRDTGAPIQLTARAWAVRGIAGVSQHGRAV
jgi:SAM-dependent methyltransferase